MEQLLLPAGGCRFAGLGACGFGGWSRVGGFLSFPAFNSPLLRLTANTDRNPTCWRAPTRELVASFRYLLQLAYGGRGPPGPQGVYASSLRFLRRCPRSTVLPIHVYPFLRRCVVFSARCINWRFSVARFLPREGMVVYSAGFFVTVSPGSIEIASWHCSEQGKTYCMNLSAPFIMQVPPFKAVLMKTMPDVDVHRCGGRVHLCKTSSVVDKVLYFY